MTPERERQASRYANAAAAASACAKTLQHTGTPRAVTSGLTKGKNSRDRVSAGTEPGTLRSERVRPQADACSPGRNDGTGPRSSGGPPTPLRPISG